MGRKIVEEYCTPGVKKARNSIMQENVCQTSGETLGGALGGGNAEYERRN
jgi:hypothetical protein